MKKALDIVKESLAKSFLKLCMKHADPKEVDKKAREKFRAQGYAEDQLDELIKKAREEVEQYLNS